jgi:hypothetical protein
VVSFLFTVYWKWDILWGPKQQSLLYIVHLHPVAHCYFMLCDFKILKFKQRQSVENTKSVLKKHQ